MALFSGLYILEDETTLVYKMQTECGIVVVQWNAIVVRLKYAYFLILLI